MFEALNSMSVSLTAHPDSLDHAQFVPGVGIVRSSGVERELSSEEEEEEAEAPQRTKVQLIYYYSGGGQVALEHSGYGCPALS